MQQAMPYLVMFAGVFSIAGAVKDWDWFMNNRRAALFVSLFGRQGARVFYGVLGVVLIGLGGFLMRGMPM